VRFPRLPNPFAKQPPSTAAAVANEPDVTKASAVAHEVAGLMSVLGWWPRIWESFAGAWQRNVVVDQEQVSANWAVFSCVTLIAGDIAKMPARVMQYDQVAQIWNPTLNRPLLRKPNSFQTWSEFMRSWVYSLLLRGNTYVLKERNSKGFVVALYVLDPNRVKPLVASDGSVYYQIGTDYLATLREPLGAVEASEIIHDRINTLYHPLVGLSPIYAHGIAAMQALAIQNNSATFFQNMSRPSGMLTAPGAIGKESAVRLKEMFETNFSAGNIGKLFVAGDGLKYEPMTITAHDAQLIDQLKFTGEMVCATMHVPPYKLALGQMPTVNNTASLNQQYYDQCLHPIVDGIERRLDDGLELEFPFETWFDTSELLRMDPATRYEQNGNGVAKGWLAPNEARRSENMGPIEGGDKPFMQEQYCPIDTLAKRPVPSKTAPPASPAQDQLPPPKKGKKGKALAKITTTFEDGATLRAAIRAGVRAEEVRAVNARGVDP
jgi:HK97 family phage portal protein